MASIKKLNQVKHSEVIMDEERKKQERKVIYSIKKPICVARAVTIKPKTKLKTHDPKRQRAKKRKRNVYTDDCLVSK